MALLLGTVAVVPQVAGAADDGALEVVAASGGSPREVTVVVPRVLRGRDVPAEAFTARVGAESLPRRVRRLEPTQLDVILAITSTGSAARDEATRAAVVELAVGLVPGARVAVVAGDPPVVRAPAQAGVDGARAASAALAGDALGTDVDAAVAVAVASRDPAREVAIVAVGADRPSHGPVVAGLPVYSVRLGSGSTPTSTRNASGGITFVRGDTSPVDAFDAVLEDLSGRNRVSIDAPVDAGPIVLAVREAGVEASVVVDAPVPPPTTVAPAPSSTGAPPATGASADDGLQVRLLLVVGLLVAVGVGAATFSARRARLEPPAHAPPPPGLRVAPDRPTVIVLEVPGTTWPASAAAMALSEGARTVVRDPADALRVVVREPAATLVLAPGTPPDDALVRAVARHDLASGRRTRVVTFRADGAVVDLVTEARDTLDPAIP